MVYGASTWTQAWQAPQSFVQGAANPVVQEVVTDLKASAAKDLTKTLPKALECGLVTSTVMLTASALNRMGNIYSPCDLFGNRYDPSNQLPVIGMCVAVGIGCGSAQAIMDITGTLFSRAVVKSLNL